MRTTEKKVIPHRVGSSTKPPTSSDDLGIADLLTIFSRFRLRLAFTYVLFGGENLIRLAQPAAIGLAVSDLILASPRGLYVLLIQSIVQLVVGTIRQLLDTRFFGQVAAELTSAMVLSQRSAGVATTRVAARSSQARQVISFLEYEMPTLIATVFSIVGTLVMMAWYDAFWGLFFGVVLVVNAGFTGKLVVASNRLSRRLHDAEESEVAVVEENSSPQVRHHYDNLHRIRVKLSDWQAASRGVTEVALVAFVLVLIARFNAVRSMSAGDLIALVRYAMIFVISLNNIPLLSQQFVRLRDICSRLVVRQPLQGAANQCDPAIADTRLLG